MRPTRVPELVALTARRTGETHELKIGTLTPEWDYNARWVSPQAKT